MLNKYAFTLVELIVVVTILAILATIGFVSYSGYLTGVRDTNRIASLTSISDGLELYRTKNDLPDPDDAIDIQIEGVDIAHQGYVGSNVLQTIEYSKAGKDPKDDSYYSYYLTDDKKHYQLMAFLEESDNLETNIISQSKAATDYKNRYPKVYGKKLGILTDDNNTPVQEIVEIKSAGFLSNTNTGVYKSYFGDAKIVTGKMYKHRLLGNIAKVGGKNYIIDYNNEIFYVDQLNKIKSCGTLLYFNQTLKNQDGQYTINPTGESEIEVYCDMTTDGGGYTMYQVIGGISTLKYTDNDSCKDIGMQIVVPRTKEHFAAMLDKYTAASFQVMPGVYKETSGRSPDYPVTMNSEDSFDWVAIDGGKWWLRDTTNIEPSGDYIGGCWLVKYGNLIDINNVIFNDARAGTECNPGYNTTQYICSTNDKQ